jgi:alkylation response protein AidB-like acyl-CoA dehydrogenase
VDETRRLFTVTFDGVAVAADRLLCEPGAAAERLLDGVLSLGVVAAAGDATGVAEVALDVTSAYAKERTQFGKPIGSFQAVKHHCANMAMAVEASRAATRAAAEALDGDPAQWRTAAGITASYVGPACAEVCALEMRVHGGIGFTWEHDTHLHLKRVKLDEVLFGTPSWHRRRLADAVFPTIVGGHR